MFDPSKLFELRLHTTTFKLDVSSLVSHLVTVIRSTKYSDTFAIVLYLVPFGFHFMGPDQQF